MSYSICSKCGKVHKPNINEVLREFINPLVRLYKDYCKLQDELANDTTKVYKTREDALIEVTKYKQLLENILKRNI